MYLHLGQPFLVAPMMGRITTSFNVLHLLVSIAAFMASCKQQAFITAVDSSENSLPTVATCLTMPTTAENPVYTGLKSAGVFDLYRKNDFKTFWTNEGVPTPNVKTMIAFIDSARFYGLLPQDYHLPVISSLINTKDCNDLFRTDALLTDAFFSIASHLKNGKSKPVVTDSTQLTILKDLNPDDLKHYLKEQEPTHKGYTLLKAALVNIYDTLNTTDRSLLLKGVISDTIDAQQLIKKIEINLERWRREKEIIEGEYVWVNIPSYKVSLVKNEKIILHSKAIVGKPKTPTPTFSSEIECFIVYPYWHVPRRIAVEEYLPFIQKDTSFIRRNNFDVLDRKGNILRYDTINWKRFNKNYFPVTLRQRDGKENALGILKFDFDNPYAVFLHDTNAKRLFKEEKRAFSQGCIRMEKAVDLAYYLAANNTKKYSPDKIREYIIQEKKQWVELVKPLPIHIRYFTCEYDGTAFRQFEDIYKFDKPISDSLYRVANPF